MALQKDITLETGAIANYWRIGRIFIDYNLKKITCYLELYVSKEARDDEKAPIYFSEMEADISLSVSGDIRQTIYNSLKVIPEFENAVDV